MHDTHTHRDESFGNTRSEKQGKPASLHSYLAGICEPSKEMRAFREAQFFHMEWAREAQKEWARGMRCHWANEIGTTVAKPIEPEMFQEMLGASSLELHVVCQTNNQQAIMIKQRR